ELATQLGNLSSQFPIANIFQFDTYSFLNGVIANPLDHNFTNVQDSCLALNCDPSDGPDTSFGFLYWDNFHPTTHGHAVIASAFASTVPEPGIVAMFIGGLFVLGIAGKRRRKIEYSCDFMEKTA
ncbi:MAG: PEP-CTERM sorting domain-containing protein, partial [Nitrosospira sp.]